MEEIKIGDIIEPTTPMRAAEFGEGVVIGFDGSHKTPVSVVFSPKKNTMIFHQFKREHVILAEVSEERIKELEKVGAAYDELRRDMQRA